MAQVKLSCQAPFFLDMTLPEQAILIRQPWVDRILEPNECFRKTWEIRSFATQKRGKFAVAVVGEKHILGEVELTDCFQVAEKVDGCWCPVSDEAPFLFDPDNAIKMWLRHGNNARLLCKQKQIVCMGAAQCSPV